MPSPAEKKAAAKEQQKVQTALAGDIKEKEPKPAISAPKEPLPEKTKTKVAVDEPVKKEKIMIDPAY